MQRRLLLSYLTITVLVLLLLEIPLGVSYARAERRRIATGVQHDALALAFRAEDRLEANDVPALRAIAVEGRRRVGGRVVIVDKHGTAVADSDPTPRTRFGAGCRLGRDHTHAASFCRADCRVRVEPPAVSWPPM